jgi:hypothetical protein
LTFAPTHECPSKNKVFVRFYCTTKGPLFHSGKFVETSFSASAAEYVVAGGEYDFPSARTCSHHASARSRQWCQTGKRELFYPFAASTVCFACVSRGVGFRRSTPPTFRSLLVCMQVKRIFGVVCTLHSLLSTCLHQLVLRKENRITFVYYLCCTFLPSLCCFPSHFACFRNDQISCKTSRNCSLFLQYIFSARYG